MISPIRPPAPSYTNEVPGFGTALAHFGHAAERLSKRVAALLTFCSICGITGSTALAYWTTHQNFVQQNQLAEINRTLENMRVLLTIEQATFGTWQARVTKVEETLEDHTERLAILGTQKKGRKIQ